MDPMLPYDEVGGDPDYDHGHIIDSVMVPADLEPVKYVVLQYLLSRTINTLDGPGRRRIVA